MKLKTFLSELFHSFGAFYANESKVPFDIVTKEPEVIVETKIDGKEHRLVISSMSCCYREGKLVIIAFPEGVDKN